MTINERIRAKTGAYPAYWVALGFTFGFGLAGWL